MRAPTMTAKLRSSRQVANIVLPPASQSSKFKAQSSMKGPEDKFPKATPLTAGRIHHDDPDTLRTLDFGLRTSDFACSPPTSVLPACFVNSGRVIVCATSAACMDKTL